MIAAGVSRRLSCVRGPRALVVVGALAATASCMSYPGNHQGAASKTDVLSFQGYTPLRAPPGTCRKFAVRVEA